MQEVRKKILHQPWVVIRFFSKLKIIFKARGDSIPKKFKLIIQIERKIKTNKQFYFHRLKIIKSNLSQYFSGRY